MRSGSETENDNYSQIQDESDISRSTTADTSGSGGNCAIVRMEPSHEPWKGINMARRRGVQKGHVHKQGKVWYVAYREDALDENGRIVRSRRNARVCEAKGVSKREAQRIADDEILNRVNSVSQRPASMMTVRQFVEGRFRTDVVKYKKHAGQLHYDYVLDHHVLPALGEKRLRDVTHDDVQSLINLKSDSGLSSQTVVHIRNVINRVFKYAKKKKAFYGELPTEDIEMPEKIVKEAHAMNFDMAMGLLKGLETVSFEAYSIVLLSLTTSMNIAELLGLRRKRVNLSAEPIVLGDRILKGESLAVRENCYRGVFGTVKMKSRNRDLPLPKVVLPVLRELMDRSKFKGPDDLVFCTEKGTPLDEKNLMRRIIKPVAVRLNMPWIGWHVFRHTHSTLAEDLGMALSDRQAQMGHGDYHMTMHYTHSDLNRRRQTLDLMADRLVGHSTENGPEPQSGVSLTLNDTKQGERMPVSH